MERVRILTLEIGCNKTIRGFTLIEILVVLLIIGIASSLLVLNAGLSDSVSTNKKSFENTFNHLAEESIITGNPIGWYANNEADLIYILDYDLDQIDELQNHKSPWDKFINNNKSFKFFDGSIIDLESNTQQVPLLIFYPSGENSGGTLSIYHSSFILETTINTNGTIETKAIKY